MKQWAIVTGAGTGIGAALVKELSKLNTFHILALGRRIEPLKQTKSECMHNEKVVVMSADISKDEDLSKIRMCIPEEDSVKYLVQNAAVGVPDRRGRRRWPPTRPTLAGAGLRNPGRASSRSLRRGNHLVRRGADHGCGHR